MKLRVLFVLGASCAALCASSAAAQEPNDKAALELAREAIDVDYLATNFPQAQQKLEQALALCKTGCSGPVRARIHRDLGVVIVTAKKDAEAGKQHFLEAFKADPKIALDRDLTTAELERLFEEARAAAGVPEAAPAEEADAEEEEEEEEKEPPTPAIPTDPTDCPPGFPGCPGYKSEQDAPPPMAHNWLSLTVQQDLMLVSSENGACTEGSSYQCFFSDDTFYDTDPIDRGNGQDGNAVSGGFRRATLRLLLGYDRFLGENIAVGARVGWAFGGGPAAPDGADFLPVHGEARLTYVFGDRPIAASGLRGYLHLSGGVAQVDAEVPVKVFVDDGSPSGVLTEVSAWRKSGTGFAGIGGGVMYALAPNHGPFFDLRVIQLFALSGTVVSPALGWALGF